MATLTETAYYSRKAIKWGTLALIGFIILRICFSLLITFIRQTFPAPPLRPNNAFGKLPKIDFPQTASPSGQLTFTLQTISGTIPEASDAARVYFMPKNKANLLSLTRAQNMVGQLGFTSTPTQTSEIEYRWTSLTDPLKSISVNIVNNHFSLNYDFTRDLSIFNENQIPTAQQAIFEATSFLQLINTGLADIDKVKPKIQYLKIVGEILVPTTSQSQANAVRIDFFRTPYDNIPVLTDQPDEGTISFIFSGSRKPNKRILLAGYNYWPITRETSAIYKLKTSEVAYKELQAGNTYYVSLPQNETRIAITSAYLAYYDSKTPQLFLQPVFVFEGEKGFLAYVPAVTPPWTE